MSARKDRQNQIISIISESQISTQDELIVELRARGYNVTQATVSRDIKELNITKGVNSSGKSVYVLNLAESRLFAAKSNSILVDAVLNIDYAMNICVIRTHVGMAGAACASIDSMNWDGILGTIAGDDTIIVICRTEEKAKIFSETLRDVIQK